MQFFRPCLFWFIFINLHLSCAFNFFPCQKRTIDFFWHLKVPALQFLPIKYGQNIKVAILDTFFDTKTTVDADGAKKHFYLKQNRLMDKKLRNVDRFEDCKHFFVGVEKNLTKNNSEGVVFDSFAKKKHGSCVVTLIQQIVPQVEIISIPIFTAQGMTNKKKLCEGLQQALSEKVDILYLGLKIAQGDEYDAQDREIIRLLSSFSYVVVAAGNDAKFEKKLAFPACAENIFFSVGAFEKSADNYIISDFSQFQQDKGPNFVMPGKDLVWSDQAPNFASCVASGTSMAAALFVGYLAHILMAAEQNFSVQQIQCILKKNSVMLDEKTWAGKVKFGTLNMPQISMCLEELQNLQSKMSSKKFVKDFERNLNKIMKKTWV